MEIKPYPILDVATKIVAIAAIPIFIYQQYVQSRNARLEKSFEFVKEFRGKEMSAVQYVLSSQWDKFSGQIDYMNRQGIALIDLENLVRSVVQSQSLTDGRPMSSAIYDMNDFFENALACGQFRHCDQAVLTNYFLDYAKQFYCLYGVIIRDRQTRLAIKNYGASLGKFVDKNGGC